MKTILSIILVLSNLITNAQFPKKAKQVTLRNIYENATTEVKPVKEVITNANRDSVQDDVSDLIKILKDRGYKPESSNRKILERYIALDNKLQSKQDSITDMFRTLKEYGGYLDNSQESNDAILKVENFRDRSEKIKMDYISKTSYEYKIMTRIDYDAFLDNFEGLINSFDKKTDKEDLDFIATTFKAKKAKFQQDSIAKEQKDVELKKMLANLPTKASIFTKFKTITYKGLSLEYFPSGFIIKKNQSSIDKVQAFGVSYPKAYYEHDSHGENSLIIRYYPGNKGASEIIIYDKSHPIYRAEFKQNSTKPYLVEAFTTDYKYQIKYSRTYNYNGGYDIRKRAWFYPNYKEMWDDFYEIEK